CAVSFRSLSRNATHLNPAVSLAPLRLHSRAGHVIFSAANARRLNLFERSVNRGGEFCFFSSALVLAIPVRSLLEGLSILSSKIPETLDCRLFTCTSERKTFPSLSRKKTTPLHFEWSIIMSNSLSHFSTGSFWSLTKRTMGLRSSF